MSVWTAVCAIEDILPQAGVCALVNDRQIAVFRVAEALYALDNIDPASGASVLSRGIVGDVNGETVVASPLFKHHYSLQTGRCLEDSGESVNVYPVRALDGRVWVSLEQQKADRPGRRRLVVIGNGMAGMRTVEELLRLAPEAYDITVFGAEPHGNYNRILLSPVLAGEQRPEDIILHGLQWYVEHGVTLHAHDAVVAIDRRRRVVRSAKGVEASYDRLLLATGSMPIILPIPGKGFPGVVTFESEGAESLLLRDQLLFGPDAVSDGGAGAARSG